MAGAVDATCQLACGSFVAVTSEQLTYGVVEVDGRGPGYLVCEQK